MNLKTLTKELAKLASEVHTTDVQGNPLTKEQVLASLLWREALGWVELVKNDMGQMERKIHPPVLRVQELLYERLEGKAPLAVSENTASIKASDKVSALARQRMNQVASVRAGPPKKKDA